MSKTLFPARQEHQFWYERSPVPTPLGIAVHLGWLNGEPSADGVAIKSLRTREVLEDPNSQREYTLTRSFRQGSSIPALWTRASGADTRVIGLSWTDESQQILTLPQTGIRNVKDLRGRRLAIPRCLSDEIDMFRATALRGFLSALELEGLGADDIELVYVERDLRRLYLAEAHALLKGEVDAIYVRGSPGLEIAQTLDAIVVIDIGFHPDPHIRNNNGTPRPLTVHGEVLRNFPDIVTGFLQLVTDAGAWAATHPNETIAYIASETSTAPGSVRAAYGQNLHRHLGVDLASTSVAALEDFKNFLFQWNLIPANFDIHDWIDAGPLTQITTDPARKRA
jgi:ABC-type nitrate/sulfonate/bicarbonate transport system substrate-binding protein